MLGHCAPSQTVLRCAARRSFCSLVTSARLMRFLVKVLFTFLLFVIFRVLGGSWNLSRYRRRSRSEHRGSGGFLSGFQLREFFLLYFGEHCKTFFSCVHHHVVLLQGKLRNFFCLFPCRGKIDPFFLQQVSECFSCCHQVGIDLRAVFLIVFDNSAESFILRIGQGKLLFCPEIE